MESSFPPKFQGQIDQIRKTGNLVPYLRFLSWFGIGGDSLDKTIAKFEGIKGQMEALVQMTVSFQDTFSALGWLLSESTNAETAKKALGAHQNGNLSKAELLLATDFEGEGLDYVVVRLCSLPEFMERKEQLVEAVNLTRENRFLASIPLLLVVADGVGSDAFGKSIFAEGVDLVELNSFAGQPDALPELIRKIAQTRRRTSSETLDFPYRNGIIHGRDLGYGNRLVNAKCWSLLGNIADVIKARNTAETLDAEPEPSFRDTLASLARSSELNEQTDSWVKRPVIEKRVHVSEEAKSRMNKHEPEASLTAFLLAWMVSNYGRMVQMTLYFDQMSINRRAGEMRRRLEEATLIEAVITRIEDEAPAVTEITVDLTFCSDGQKFVNDYVFRMICQDGSGGAAVRGYDGAQWLILKGYEYQWWSDRRS